MRKLCRVFTVLILAFLICTQYVNACTVNIESLRKTYRQSKNIFLGEIISIESIKTEELPENLKEYKNLEKLTFKVEKSWKGSINQVVVYSSPFCDCPMRQYNFSVGKKFLVFADKNSNLDVCNLSNIQIDSDSNKNSEIIMKRLDKFWFRTWASIYPF